MRNGLPLQLKWLHRPVQCSRVSYVLSSFRFRSLFSLFTWDWSCCLFRQTATSRAIGGLQQGKMASTRRRKTFCGLDSQSFALVGPLERLGHRAIVIVNEGQDFGLQLLKRRE